MPFSVHFLTICTIVISACFGRVAVFYFPLVCMASEQVSAGRDFDAIFFFFLQNHRIAVDFIHQPLTLSIIP
ncbi:hypothetical protein XENTR_v10020733 [Xenopus tropicalis]|nr:hypothetical protein XENTR_v10020733 [Xenopus tropicalis]